MNIEPLGPPKRRPRPVALLEPGIGCAVVHTADGTVEARGEKQVRAVLDTLAEHKAITYVNSRLTRCRFMTDARAWTATVWREKAVAMSLGRFKAISLRGALDGSDSPMDDLLTFLAFAAGHNVQPASVGTMAMNLWRATLERPLEVWADPEVSGPALYGGRQWAGEPKVYRHMTAFDIRCAYPHAMWALGPYASRLRKVDPSTELSDEPGIARAAVGIPVEAHQGPPMGPLPVRLTEISPDLTWWPTAGAHEGVWPWRELVAARELGCSVRVVESWAPGALVYPFRDWEPIVRQARALPGGAAGLGKVCTNALWGSFALDGERSSWGWDTRSGTKNAAIRGVEKARNLPQRGLRHWAAETTARVRVRMLTEGIYQDRMALLDAPPIHIDTDGLIRRTSAPCPEPAGDELGQWRRAKEMRTLDLKAPQVYRWSCVDCGHRHARWHYVTSGLPEEAAIEKWGQDVKGLSVMVHMDDGQLLHLSPLAKIRRRHAALIAAQRALLEPPAMFVPDAT